MFVRNLRACIDNGLFISALKDLHNVRTCMHCKMLTHARAAKHSRALIQSILDYAAAFG